MKVLHDEKTPAGFRPITITFVIETEEELNELWHRINANLSDIEKDHDVFVPFPEKDNTTALLKALNRYIEYEK